MDKAVKAKCIHEQPVIDDDSFVQQYTELTEIITSVAASVFGHMKPYVKRAEVITNGKIKGILTDLKHVGGAIHFEKLGHIARVSLKVRDLHMHALGDFAREASDIPFVQYLTRKCKRLYKSLFAERSKEIILQACIGDRQQIAATLKSSSTWKFVHLSDFIPFPLAINNLDDPERLVCDPEGVKSTTRDYFTRLYDHS